MAITCGFFLSRKHPSSLHHTHQPCFLSYSPVTVKSPSFYSSHTPCRSTTTTTTTTTRRPKHLNLPPLRNKHHKRNQTSKIIQNVQSAPQKENEKEELKQIQEEITRLSNDVQRTIREETVERTSMLPNDRRKPIFVTYKTEDLGSRYRKISGSIQIPQVDMNRIWKVLTSYNDLKLFIPNILECYSKTIDQQLCIDQILLISRKLRLRSRMLCKVYEDLDHYSVTFKQIEGRDFQTFIAQYSLVPHHNTNKIVLSYQAFIQPFPLYPITLVENKITKELPGILTSIRYEAVVGKHIPLHSSNSISENIKT